MNDIQHATLQKKLDNLDELIDTLEREKQAAGDNDLLRDVEEAKEFQQMAREAYSRGELQHAWGAAEHAEYCAISGRDRLSKLKEIIEEIGKVLNNTTT